MANFLSKYTMIIFISGLVLLNPSMIKANDFTDHEYVDFSTDRSTWFFRINGGNNNTAFFDFFFPFDPTRRIGIYDPLIKYELDKSYYFTPDNLLMISLEDLKKLYAPYFDFQIKDESLFIQHTVFEKVLLSGSGRRSTSIEYTKKVWHLKINLDNKKIGFLNYTEYESAKGGRNRPVQFNNKIKSGYKDKNINFKRDVIQLKNDDYFVPLAEIMKLMGKAIFVNKGYLHIQNKNIADVTVDINRSENEKSRQKITAPNAGNPWHGGTIEPFDNNYAWADYMNDVADGKRKAGWLWSSFYIPSGENFVDKNGQKITLKADRIIPYNFYIPSTYDEEKSKLLFMLHGGTGNENTSTYRIMLRNTPIDQYAETFGYILVSPNGWAQNPMWREGQALYSFLKSAESTLEKYPIKKDRLFITGNSMGGKGTLEIVMRHPGMFRAMAPTAMKITDRTEDFKKSINIEGTKYSLKNISDMPTFIVQGTADTVTSYQTQIGNRVDAGSIVKAVMPKLNNALYLAVEGGDHSYSFASLLIPMFEFFESVLNPYKENFKFDTLYLSGKSKIAYLDDEKFELSAIESTNNTVMLPLCDLEKIYGESFKVYKVSFKNRNPEKSKTYYTVFYNKTSINLCIDTNIYRKNIERYKEDGNVRSRSANTQSGKKKSDMEFLDHAPRFSTPPYEKSGKIFIPVQELMKELGRKIVIKK